MRRTEERNSLVESDNCDQFRSISISRAVIKTIRTIRKARRTRRRRNSRSPHANSMKATPIGTRWSVM